MHDDEQMAMAWAAFVADGTIMKEIVRPEIARSWERCRKASVNPWSSTFPSMDERLLNEKRARYAHSLETNQPIMQMLLALLHCNVSLHDHENFVFEFFSPLSYYPRTFGTHVREEELGTGNATLVAYERKPVRVEGFEQYRAVSQGYSGVSAPFIDAEGNYFGALNLNSPLSPLPNCALEMCAMGVSLSDELFLMRRGMWTRLRSLEFFRPLVELMSSPVLIVDTDGRILLANGAMDPYVAGYDQFPYGTQSLEAYLGKASKLDAVLNVSIKDAHDFPVHFKVPGKRKQNVLNCLHKREVQFKNGLRFFVLVFEEAKKGEEQPAPPRATRRLSEPVAAMSDYIGESDEWRRVDNMVNRVSTINANVLLLGETGTGKEMVARAIHRRSGRKGNFIAINCGAIPRDLFAAELFGYESGAFTGAKEGGSLGRIEAANHGTVLLDEIGEMPLDMQVGLLRVIQERAVTRLGSSEAHELDVRFIAATNQDLESLIDKRMFRADLYYRLSTVEIQLPPLRARDGDIELLADYFNAKASELLGLTYTPFSEDVLASFAGYSWPGNVRELSNVVERVLIMAGEGASATVDDLPAHIANARSFGVAFVPSVAGEPLADDKREGAGAHASLYGKDDDDERRVIIDLLSACNGNMSKAAAALGISRTTLYKRMEKHHLHVKVVVETD